MAEKRNTNRQPRSDAVGPGGKAHGVDPRIKAANLKRLQRIEGQVRGVHRMVEEDRYCADVLAQISAVCRALHAVGTEVLRNHLRHCATDAIKGDPKSAEAMYDELLDLMNRNKC